MQGNPSRNVPRFQFQTATGCDERFDGRGAAPRRVMQGRVAVCISCCHVGAQRKQDFKRRGLERRVMQERRAGRVARGHIDPSRDKCFKNPLVLAGYGVESDRGGGILRHHARHGRQEHFQDSRIPVQEGRTGHDSLRHVRTSRDKCFDNRRVLVVPRRPIQGVSPRESNAVTSAPASRRASMTEGLLVNSAAPWRGVRPEGRLNAITSAPAATNSRTRAGSSTRRPG